MKTWNDRLAYAMKIRGINSAELARLAGVKQPSVWEWVNGETKNLKNKNLLNVSSILKISPQWLVDGTGSMDAEQTERFIHHIKQQSPGNNADGILDEIHDAPPLRAFRDVPIVGEVQGGDNGYLLELEYPPGHGDGSIHYPAKDNNSYALRVRGDSMRPRIKSGEFIVVEPSTQPQPGDDVVVICKDGRRMVKELLYFRNGEVALGSINNGHGQVTLTVENIETMHYVAAIVPRGAFYRKA